jgi:hypothetical protein
MINPVSALRVLIRDVVHATPAAIPPKFGGINILQKDPVDKEYFWEIA